MDCGVDGTYALRSAVAVRSSPAAAERCAKGAGLDGMAHGRSTITRAVTQGYLLHLRQAADRYIKYTAKLHQLDGRYPRLRIAESPKPEGDKSVNIDAGSLRVGSVLGARPPSGGQTALTRPSRSSFHLTLMVLLTAAS